MTENASRSDQFHNLSQPVDNSQIDTQDLVISGIVYRNDGAAATCYLIGHLRFMQLISKKHEHFEDICCGKLDISIFIVDRS